jgi:hypothetical protein
VPPPSSEISETQVILPISLPSLHLIGENDPFKEKSYKLTQLYTEETRTILTHTEDHRVPTIATQIYPSIYSWLQNHIK